MTIGVAALVIRDPVTTIESPGMNVTRCEAMCRDGPSITSIVS